MKNLKKMSFNLASKELSRKELKGIMAGSYCLDMCTPSGVPGVDICRQYGLRCGWFQCGNTLVNRCM